MRLGWLATRLLCWVGRWVAVWLLFWPVRLAGWLAGLLRCDLLGRWQCGRLADWPTGRLAGRQAHTWLAAACALYDCVAGINSYATIADHCLGKPLTCYLHRVAIGWPTGMADLCAPIAVSGLGLKCIITQWQDCAPPSARREHTTSGCRSRERNLGQQYGGSWL